MTLPGDAQAVVLKGATEAELLGFMARQGAEPGLARAAWSELYTRHVRYMFAVVSRTYGRFLGAEATADLVADTFHRAFDWAGRQPDPDFVVARFSEPDRDVVRRKALSWLSAIAERLFQDCVRKRASTTREVDIAIELWKSRNAVPEPAASPDVVARLQAALETLSREEAEALRISLPWYDVHTGAFSFPRGEAAEAARRLGITPDVLRQRRHRALKHIETHFGDLASARRDGETT